MIALSVGMFVCLFVCLTTASTLRENRLVYKLYLLHNIMSQKFVTFALKTIITIQCRACCYSVPRDP